MLVLSRKKNESIVIDDDITIVVVEILGNKVRLGIEAPKEVPVHRREVFDAIHRNEVASQQSQPKAEEPKKEDPSNFFCQDDEKSATQTSEEVKPPSNPEPTDPTKPSRQDDDKLLDCD